MDFVSTMSGCRVGHMTGFGQEENVIDMLTIKRGEDLAGLEGPKLNGIVIGSTDERAVKGKV